jgi:hypothetical protein
VLVGEKAGWFLQTRTHTSAEANKVKFMVTLSGPAGYTRWSLATVPKMFLSSMRKSNRGV